MKNVNMHEAKTHLSRLVEAATKGEPFVIARAGKPLVRVEALEAATPTRKPQRIGFLAAEWGHLDFDPEVDRQLDLEIIEMFERSNLDSPLDWGALDDASGPDGAADEGAGAADRTRGVA